MHDAFTGFFNSCGMFSAEPYVLNCQVFRNLLKDKNGSDQD